MLLASTAPGDIVLDPFAGTGTTAVVAKRLHRHFIGIERHPAYVEAALGRVRARPSRRRRGRGHDAVPARDAAGAVRQPGGARAAAARNRCCSTACGGCSAVVAADGIDRAPAPSRGSIHKVGAAVQNAPSCNGWTFWHIEQDGALVPIDVLRGEPTG